MDQGWKIIRLSITDNTERSGTGVHFVLWKIGGGSMSSHHNQEPDEVYFLDYSLVVKVLDIINRGRKQLYNSEEFPDDHTYKIFQFGDGWRLWCRVKKYSGSWDSPKSHYVTVNELEYLMDDVLNPVSRSNKKVFTRSELEIHIETARLKGVSKIVEGIDIATSQYMREWQVYWQVGRDDNIGPDYFFQAPLWLWGIGWYLPIMGVDDLIDYQIKYGGWF